MGLTATPPLDASEREAVIRAVLNGAGEVHARPPAYRSGWGRAGRVEATEAWPSEERYALSPRSTRGATRA